MEPESQDQAEQVDRSVIESRVKPPAIGLLVTGIIGVLLSLSSLVMAPFAAEMQEKQREQMEQEELPEDARRWMEMMDKLQPGGGMAMAFAALGLLGSAFVAFGALKMMKLQSHGLAMAASIVSFVPYVSGCCCLGLVFGIWGLVVLSKPEVKEAFTA